MDLAAWLTVAGLVINFAALLFVAHQNKERQIQIAVKLEARLTAMEIWIKVLAGRDPRFQVNKNVHDGIDLRHVE